MNHSYRTVVVKVGTSTLTHASGMLNIRKIEELCKIICDLQNSGLRMIVVSSGAVSAGKTKLRLHNVKLSTEQKQAAASIGQCELMDMYSRNMAMFSHTVGQILLTKYVLDNKERRQNAENTFRILLESDIIPVVNENDSVSCEGIRFGGNDTLAAYVALLAHADLLINLSDVGGLYDSDPRKNPNATLIEEVRDIQSIKHFATGAGTDRGTGGMVTKLEAAEIVTANGIPMRIADGASPAILYDICEGKARGTLFIAKETKTC